MHTFSGSQSNYPSQSVVLPVSTSCLTPGWISVPRCSFFPHVCPTQDSWWISCSSWTQSWARPPEYWAVKFFSFSLQATSAFLQSLGTATKNLPVIPQVLIWWVIWKIEKQPRGVCSFAWELKFEFPVGWLFLATRTLSPFSPPALHWGIVTVPESNSGCRVWAIDCSGAVLKATPVIIGKVGCEFRAGAFVPMQGWALGFWVRVTRRVLIWYCLWLGWTVIFTGESLGPGWGSGSAFRWSGRYQQTFP